MEECSFVSNSIFRRTIVAIALRKGTLSNVEFRKLPVSGDFSLLLSFDGSKRK